VLASWQGPASEAFEAKASALRSGLQVLAGYYSDAAAAIGTYASVLEGLQQQVMSVASSFAGAESSYSATLSSLASRGPAPAGGPGLPQQEQAAADGFARAEQAALSACEDLCADARSAAAACAGQLEQLASEARALAQSRFAVPAGFIEDMAYVAAGAKKGPEPGWWREVMAFDKHAEGYNNDAGWALDGYNAYSSVLIIKAAKSAPRPRKRRPRRPGTASTSR
jgi:hypothetical protein